MYPRSKILNIYKECETIILEKVDEFHNKEMHCYTTEEDLIKGLDSFSDIIDEYEIFAPKELRKRIKGHLNK